MGKRVQASNIVLGCTQNINIGLYCRIYFWIILESIIGKGVQASNIVPGCTQNINMGLYFGVYKDYIVD